MAHNTRTSNGAPDEDWDGDYLSLVDDLIHHIITYLGSSVTPIAERVAMDGGDPTTVLEVVAMTLHCVADGLEGDPVSAPNRHC